MTKFTHKLLCELAVGWLQRPASRQGPGCKLSFSETKGSWDGEIPDAIGFRVNLYRECSVLVEVKVTRPDFLADLRKPHRLDSELGMGTYRYYFAPKGLIKVEELPAKWGLVEVNAKGHIVVRAGHVLLGYCEEDTWQHNKTIHREWTLLACVLGRVGDVEKFNGWLKESRNMNARLIKTNERLTAENNALHRDLISAKNHSDELQKRASGSYE